MSLLTHAIDQAKVIYGLKQENDTGYSSTYSNSYTTLNFLDDTTKTLEDKRTMLLTFLQNKKLNPSKLYLKKEVLKRLNTVMTSYHYYENKNGGRAIKNLTEFCISYEFGDRDMCDLVELLLKKTFECNSAYFDQFKAKVDELTESLKDVIAPKKQDYDGSGTSDCREGQRFEYHTHPGEGDKITSTKGLKEKESLKGFEYEGSFASRQDFINCMEEMHNTDFMNGKLYDERNFFMPTKDGSLYGAYPVEFGFCPMSTQFAKEFFKVFLDILKKHNGESSSRKNNSGIHCHLDAKLFTQKTLKKLIDVVYDMPNDKKLELYQRDGSSYNNGEKDSCFSTTNRFVKTNVKNENNEYYYLLTKIIESKYRRTLLNLEHIHYREYDETNSTTNYDKISGTVELRGFNSCVDITSIIDPIDKIVDDSLN